MEEETKLVPIKDDERDSSGRLLPEVKERVIEQIEAYITEKKEVNINAIAKHLDIGWEAAERYALEVTNRWKQEDTKSMQQVRKRMTAASKLFIEKIEEKAANKTLTLAEMQDTIVMFKDVMDWARLEEGYVESVNDASKVVSVHFNNLNVSPSMAKEIQKTRIDGTPIHTGGNIGN